MKDEKQQPTHTPGQWKPGFEYLEVRSHGSGSRNGGKIGLLIATVNQGMSDCKANAELIAKAPELFEEVARLQAENEQLREAAEQFEMTTHHIDLSKIPVGHVVTEHVLITGEMIKMLRDALTKPKP